MQNSIKTIYSREEIQIKVQELADSISKDYQGKDLLLCGILNGAYIFLSDLSRSMSIPHKIDFMSASSYGDGMTSSGNVSILKYPDTNPTGKDILIIEDIIETGSTLETILEYLLEEGAKSVKICTLVQKEKSIALHPFVDYYGFMCGDEFLIGYGMDYAGFYRNLPFIGVMES